MKIINRFFGNKSENNQQEPSIRFGRYSDSYKIPEQYDAWDLALEKFEKKQYLDSYKAFFKYLRDETEDNVKYWEEGKKLHFEILQGSSRITGTADHKKIRVEARVAKAKKLNMYFMTRMVEQNYQLKHSRFGLDTDNYLTIVFDSFVIDGSPYKLYYAIKELAINADKQDDLLIDEFEELEPVEVQHLVDLPQSEKKVKYNFIIQKIKTVLNEIEHGKLNSGQYPGAIAYLLLDLSYKLDFLTTPEGIMMESLERMNRLYFAKDVRTTEQKNEMLQEELRSMLERSEEEFFKEMYLVKTTFGITKSVDHQTIRDIIDGELGHMDWFLENKYDAIALAISGYIVGNCLFNHAVSKPVKELFTLYYRILEPDFFHQLGFLPRLYNTENNVFDRKNIRNKIKSIVLKYKEEYPLMDPDLNKLKYGNLTSFGKSFLIMVCDLNMTVSN